MSLLMALRMLLKETQICVVFVPYIYVVRFSEDWYPSVWPLVMVMDYRWDSLGNHVG